jgi:hypothetical protein
MIPRPPYKKALGIAPGDIITTSYGTGPYEVWDISSPRYWHKHIGALVIWPWPVISLILFHADNPPETRSYHFAYINDIHCDNGRWFTDNGDEIFVEKPQQPRAIQMSLPLTSQNTAVPYDFQPGVDYRAGDGRVFHCPQCSCDFNAVKTGHQPVFHDCGTRYVSLPIITMGNAADRRSEYVRSINA